MSRRPKALRSKSYREGSLAQKTRVAASVVAMGFPSHEATSTTRLAIPVPTLFPKSIRRWALDDAKATAETANRQECTERIGAFGVGILRVGYQEHGADNPPATIGTLTRKIDPTRTRQQQAPAIGPTRCRFRWSQPRSDSPGRSAGSRKTSLMIDSDAGMVNAAPLP